MSFTTVTGTLGSVKISTNSVGDITNWDFTKKAYNTKWASSESGGFKKSAIGVKEGSGKIEGKLDTAASCPIDVGVAATLILGIDGTHHYTVPAVITEFALKVDMNTGEVVGFTASFENNGSWTEPSWG